MTEQTYTLTVEGEPSEKALAEAHRFLFRLIAEDEAKAAKERAAQAEEASA